MKPRGGRRKGGKEERRRRKEGKKERRKEDDRKRWKMRLPGDGKNAKESLFLQGENRVLNQPPGRSLSSFAPTAHPAHSLSNSLLSKLASIFILFTRLLIFKWRSWNFWIRVYAVNSLTGKIGIVVVTINTPRGNDKDETGGRWRWGEGWGREWGWGWGWGIWHGIFTANERRGEGLKMVVCLSVVVSIPPR